MPQAIFQTAVLVIFHAQGWMRMDYGGIRAIIFDMDNTLLRSNIDFKAMKSDVCAFLKRSGAISPETKEDEHTTATLIEAARSGGVLNAALDAAVWEIVRRYEVEGMRGANLEPHVDYMLEKFSGRFVLAVLTNNSCDAAVSALGRNGIDRYFNLIAGREQVPGLKPSPAGMLHIMGRYPEISADGWLSVGDSWIDGRASMDAGIRFICYRGDIDKMNRNGVYPPLTIQDMAELPEILA
jgi:phosphoglycolate phosphatase